MLLIDNSDDVRNFIRLYNEARSKYKTQFRFKDRDILVSYAYYSIEYMVTAGYVKGVFDKDKKFTIHEEAS
jgi:hypothetical protein